MNKNVYVVIERTHTEGRVFYSVRETTLFFLNGIITILYVVYSLALKEKLSTQNTM